MSAAPAIPLLTVAQVEREARAFLSVAGYVGLKNEIPVELRITVRAPRPDEHYGEIRRPAYRTVYAGHYRTGSRVRDGWRTVTEVLYRHRFAWLPLDARTALDASLGVARQVLEAHSKIGVARFTTSIEWTEGPASVDVQLVDRREGQR